MSNLVALKGEARRVFMRGHLLRALVASLSGTVGGFVLWYAGGLVSSRFRGLGSMVSMAGSNLTSVLLIVFPMIFLVTLLSTRVPSARSLVGWPCGLLAISLFGAATSPSNWQSLTVIAGLLLLFAFGAGTVLARWLRSKLHDTEAFA